MVKPAAPTTAATNGGQRYIMGSRSRWLLALLPVVLFLAGCGDTERPLNTLDPAGRKAEDIDKLIQPIFIACYVVFIFIMGMVLFIGKKFSVPKAKEGETLYPGGYADEEFPEQVHGNQALEWGWTAVPAVVMVLIAIFSVAAWLKLDDVQAAPAGASHPEMEVLVVGQQWWWEYHYYLDGIEGASEPDFVTANEMVIPVGQDVGLSITSRDVIHSFWIPRLNGKRDAVPGRVHPWVIQANEVGRFAGQCTEFCGLSHAYMRMYTMAIPDDEFATWVDQQMTPVTPLVEGDENFDGQQAFVNNCARCHVVDGLTQRDRDGEGPDEAVLDSMEMYGNIEEFRDHSDGTLSRGMFTGAENLTAGAAPNLTHFASRTSYAGSFFELYPDAQAITEAGDFLEMAASTPDRGTLEAWIRNAPAEKPNAAEDFRGMPNLNLAEDDIDLIVDYLLSLD